MLFRKILSSLMVVALGVTPWLSLRADTLPPHVVINELLWMGSPASSSDEWIELRNFEPVPVDLSGWKLTRRSSGSDAAMLTIPAGKIIPASGYFLISNFAETSTSSDVAVTPDVVDPAVSLVNSALQIKLLDPTGAVIDVADDGTGSPLSGSFVSGTSYASMARNGLAADGTLATSWHSSTTKLNLKSASLVLGTPGAANENVPPVIPTMTDTTMKVGDVAQFDVSDTTDPDGDPFVCTWNFGDGISVSGVTASHTYTSAGSYIASVTCSDLASTNTQSMTVTVSTLEANPVNGSTDGKVLLSELLPNPVGPDIHEFIELHAPDADVDVSGWKLTDASGTTYIFPAGTVLVKGTYLAFDRSVTKIALNNDEDTVTLSRLDATIADTVSFAGADEGAAYIVTPTGWQWTTKPTPNAGNILERLNHAPVLKFSVTPAATKRRAGSVVTFDASDSNDADGDVLRVTWKFGDGSSGIGDRIDHVYSTAGTYTVEVTARDSSGATDVDERDVSVKDPLKGATLKKGTVKGAATVTTIEDTKTASSSTEALIHGLVSAAPGLLGSNMFYLTDGSTGIGVKVNAGLPKLKVGDAITVRGEKRTTAGEAYVLVNSLNDVVSGDPTEAKTPEPKITETDSLDVDSSGQLVQVEGEVTSLSGARFSLDDGSGEVAVYVKSTTGFKRPAMHSGDRVRVVGIVSSSTSGLRVLPRTLDDIAVTVVNHPSDTQSVSVPPAKKPPLWAYGLVLLSAVGGYGFTKYRKQVKER